MRRLSVRCKQPCDRRIACTRLVWLRNDLINPVAEEQGCMGAPGLTVSDVARRLNRQTSFLISFVFERERVLRILKVIEDADCSVLAILYDAGPGLV